MSALSSRLHARLGDFWWYSILMFVALRIGDVINAFVGLWLVPKYVDATELGAVLAITNVASTFGLPITILVTIYTKFLNRYQAQGERGKVKSLLSWFIGATCLFVIISTILSIFVLPHFFTRIRVAKGSLGILIVASGIIGAVSPVFSNALQGLKKFGALIVQNLFSAPVRLITMILTIPIRALSGYMLGQLAAPLFTIGWACFNLRSELRHDIKSIPFWRGEGKRILKYLFCVSIWFLSGGPYAAIMTMIIRQRLPECDSAAYYIISRFAEFSAFAGITLMIIMFPLASEAHTHGKDTRKLLRNANCGTLGFGLLTVFVLYFFGSFILGILPTSAPYASYSSDMALLAATLVIGQIWSNYTMHELARERFGFLFYSVPLNVIQAILLVCFTGYTYFSGILPQKMVEMMGQVNLATLHNLLLFQLVWGLLRILIAWIDFRLHRIPSYHQTKAVL